MRFIKEYKTIFAELAEASKKLSDGLERVTNALEETLKFEAYCKRDNSEKSNNLISRGKHNGRSGKAMD